MTAYDDIIDLPYEGVKYHKRMAVADRAVIMSAFDALTGLGHELSVAARQAEDEALDDGYEELDY